MIAPVPETTQANDSRHGVSVAMSPTVLESDVRLPWTSNCAGEIFVVHPSGDEGLRIGHFQGDAVLATYVVSMHNAALIAAGCDESCASVS